MLVDDTLWADRSEFWRTYRPVVRGAPKKFKYREPLILCGHGIRIRVNRNTLLIRNGFTHHPQKSEEIRFFPGDSNLPDRIIILDGSGGISLDALNWMSGQKIIFAQLNWQGEINNVGGGSGYSADPQLVDAQRKSKIGRRNSEIARWLIGEKIDASISTLRNVPLDPVLRDGAIQRLQKRRAEIRTTRKSISKSQLLGIEGECAAAYYRTWHGLSLKWSGSKRKPVPDNWLKISPRGMSWQKTSQNARHPINAMLNYGYGILKGQIRSEIIAAGLDPTIGIMHGSARNRIPLVYDLMEPLRPVVDRVVLKFSLAHTFTSGDFSINQVGGCRLNPQFAKALVQEISLGNAPKQIAAEYAQRL
jgi:CRISPR-associated protein Cas1